VIVVFDEVAAKPTSNVREGQHLVCGPGSNLTQVMVNTMVMGLHLLNGLSCQFNHTIAIGSDSQALIKALDNQQLHASQYILDEIHNLAEHLHSEQDKILNKEFQAVELCQGNSWKACTKGVIDLHIHWVPGHCDFPPNERADEEAKKAAQGFLVIISFSLIFFEENCHSAFLLLNRSLINTFSIVGKDGGKSPCSTPPFILLILPPPQTSSSI